MPSIISLTAIVMLMATLIPSGAAVEMTYREDILAFIADGSLGDSASSDAFWPQQSVPLPRSEDTNAARMQRGLGPLKPKPKPKRLDSVTPTTPHLRPRFSAAPNKSTSGAATTFRQCSDNPFLDGAPIFSDATYASPQDAVNACAAVRRDFVIKQTSANTYTCSAWTGAPSNPCTVENWALYF